VDEYRYYLMKSYKIEYIKLYPAQILLLGFLGPIMKVPSPYYREHGQFISELR
jgi:hypothetical protein